jgi:hypothetical protein
VRIIFRQNSTISFGMERRKEPRVDINQEVTVTVLGNPDSEPFKAMAVDISGPGMRIRSPRPVPYQAAVKVEAGNMLWLAEAIRVQPSEGGHMIALKLGHSVDLSGDLRRLNQALRDEQKIPRSQSRLLNQAP